MDTSFLDNMEPDSPPSARYNRIVWIDDMPVLELRDPNEGHGGEPRTKTRHQYMLADGHIWHRRLPPETVGDAWADVGVPGWEPRTSVARGPISDYAAAARAYDCVVDVAFEDAQNVGAIRYRFAPIDVGFDLRDGGQTVEIVCAPRVRVSYAVRGERRVVSGPLEYVVAVLEKAGYSIETV